MHTTTRHVYQWDLPGNGCTNSAALFSIAAFGGGFAVQSLLALWLYQRFDMTFSKAAMLFQFAGCIFAFGRKLDRRTHRSGEHHGVYPFAIKCFDHAGAVHADTAAGHRLPLSVLGALLHGRADASVICNGGDLAGRTSRRCQSYECAAQSRVRLESGAGRIYANDFQFWLAAGSMWCVEDRV